MEGPWGTLTAEYRHHLETERGLAQNTVRAYQADGSLVPRSKEGAVIHDKQLAIARTVRMVKEGKVTAITGEDVPLRADSICVHGDNPSAVEFVRDIRKTLTEEGIRIEALGNFIQ